MNNLFSISILSIFILFWILIIIYLFILFFLKNNKKNQSKMEKKSLIDHVFASNVKFFFSRNQFTKVVFESKPPFLENKQISMELFLNFLSIEDKNKFFNLLLKRKNQKQKINKKFDIQLQIGSFIQKYYFKNIGFFSKSISTNKVYNSNYLLFLMSNLK